MDGAAAGLAPKEKKSLGEEDMGLVGAATLDAMGPMASCEGPDGATSDSAANTKPATWGKG